MSAKVYKKEAAAPYNSFRIPGIGGAPAQTGELQGFVFPQNSAYPQTQRTETRESFGSRSSENAIEFVLQSAREEAAQIIAAAEQHSAAVALAAKESGLNEARQLIENEVTAQVMTEISRLREELTSTIGQMTALTRQIAEQAETELLELSLDIAKKIVGREVSIDREVALYLVKISLAKLHNRTFATIHLNPIDFAFIEAHRDRLDFQGSIEIVEDRSVSPGGCLVHTETGAIDGRIESQFDEIAHGLLGK
jgi:flagellar assembly protein FliH